MSFIMAAPLPLGSCDCVSESCIPVTLAWPRPGPTFQYSASCVAASSGYILCALICPNKRYVFSKYAYAGRQRIVSARRQLLLQLFLPSFRWQSAGAGQH
uniref:HDC07058 n=1 Tax=Drosophila melanogaster TaxID=7227 RepID=Q6IG82_DROME|nr:TPA_inf: HDC07058 [Drosophila melanogaster]